ncbi:MAG: nuclear transport factor 2 family protein [Chloroflexota bacterium]
MLNEATVSHDPMAVVRRLQEATNRHDLDALVGCFADDYLSEIPVHPSRTFRGREQVRRNWAQILAGVPDLRSELVRSATNGTEVWAEWEWTGTRRDGAPHLMRGTTVLNVEGDEIAWARFYMEPVVDDGATVEASVRQSVTPANAPEVGPEPGNEPGPTR